MNTSSRQKTPSRIRDGLTVLLLVAITVVIAYFYVNPQARNQTWQSLYPVRAKMALSHLRCSPNSPGWMADTLRLATTRLRAPANQIAYLSPQGTLYHCESGYTGLPWLSSPVSAHSRFRLASVTKLWTADAVLRLAAQNRLDLDAPILPLLPMVPSPQDERLQYITAQHLLLHQGGFDRHSVFGTDMFQQGQEEICPRHLPQLAKLKLNFDPGSKSSYSNLGYCLLGEIVAQKTQQPYTRALEQQYGLSTDGLVFVGQNALPDEVNYNHEEQGLMGIADIYTAFNYADLASAAGLSGHASGVARQVKAMLQHELNITSMPTIQTCDPTQLRSCYSYAMYAYRPSSNRTAIWFRDGNLPGLSSLVMVDEKGGVVVLLSNGLAQDGAQGGDEIKQFLYQKYFDH